MRSSKRTKHINVRCFFVKQKIDDKEVVIVWCPTYKLVGDFFSKPLSGAKFIEFRFKIMNYTKTDRVDNFATCLHQMNIMDSNLAGEKRCYRCGVKKKIHNTSSTEQAGWEHKIPEKMDMKDAFEYNELPMSKDPNDCGIVKASHKKANDSRPLIGPKADELKHVNFYNHSHLVKRNNIMEEKEARDFRKTVCQRAHNVWVNLEINRMIRFQHNNLKTWVREDKDVRYYVDNTGYGGPKWDDVKIKQTFDALTGYMIEY